jgi:putative glutamine amidotransferase
MKLIAITQRVEQVTETGERRDALDQRWVTLLQHIGFSVLPLPNNIDNSLALIKTLPIQGIILSGGNSLCDYGGDAPERDKLEALLLDYSKKNKLPLLGVCRGMQLIQQQENIPLQTIKGHVCKAMTISLNQEGQQGQQKTVNSYHNWGTYQSSEPLIIDAVAQDGVIKAIHHRDYPIKGIMWHPERESPFSTDDLQFITRFFTS